MGEESSKAMLRVTGVIAQYWVVSISLVYINKFILSEQSAPIFITWSQCIVTCVICWVCGALGEKMRETQSGATREKAEEGGHAAGKPSPDSSFLAGFPKARYDRDAAIKVLPLSMVFVLMILSNQLTLKYVEVSFYNVASGLRGGGAALGPGGAVGAHLQRVCQSQLHLHQEGAPVRDERCVAADFHQQRQCVPAVHPVRCLLRGSHAAGASVYWYAFLEVDCDGSGRVGRPGILDGDRFSHADSRHESADPQHIGDCQGGCAEHHGVLHLGQRGDRLGLRRNLLGAVRVKPVHVRQDHGGAEGTGKGRRRKAALAQVNESTDQSSCAE